MAEPRPIFIHLTAKVREEHEWVSRAGGLFRFVLMECEINGRPDSGTRVAVLVTDLDAPEEP